MITEFQGEYRWLSNFELVNVFYKGYWFPSTENAYQACKSESMSHMLKCQLCAPNVAKRLGKMCTLRDNWLDIRLQIMYDLNMLKYSNEEYSLLLVYTGDQEIIEGNTWHDNFWGNCMCPKCKNIPGQNNLGKIIMKIRSIIGGT